MQIKVKCLLVIMFFGLAPIVWADTTLLATPQGSLIGETVGVASSVRAFKGIPYAAPPVGVRRWQPPAAAPVWRGELLATSFASNCMQEPYPENSFYYRPARLTSEDCLYLNVWTAAEVGESLPVMVWIHGGALTRGSGATVTYDGTSLAQKGVVLVTINYRLGVFGYFAHPELIEESPSNAAGNYGLLDKIKALEWVKANVEAFGGDASNVTIFGESAGSWSVNLLTASPLADGLFHKAIGESGARLDPRMTIEEAAEDGIRLSNSVDAESLLELRQIPAADLLTVASSERFRTDAIVDGWSIPDQPFNLFSEGRQNKVPVLIGYNAEEGTTLGVLQRIPENDDVYISRARSLYGDLAGEFLDVYPVDDIRRSTLDSYRDSSFGWNMITWARLTEKVNENAYLYYFSHEPPGENQRELGAYHAAEIAYAFDNAHTLRAEPSESDIEMASIISDYWINFARSGNPNGPGLTEWKEFSNVMPNYLEFNDGATAGSDITPDAWNFFDKLQARRRQ